MSKIDLTSQEFCVRSSERGENRPLRISELVDLTVGDLRIEPKELIRKVKNDKIDDLVKSTSNRHPGEPRIGSGAGAGVHPAKGGMEITGFRLSPE
jgi:hypothetical protein